MVRGERLDLPIHELELTADPASGEFEILLNERDGGDWVYRRNPSVRLPLSKALLMSKSGIASLLRRSPSSTSRGELATRTLPDARNVLPVLSAEARAWLAAAIGPDNPFSDFLQ